MSPPDRRLCRSGMSLADVVSIVVVPLVGLLIAIAGSGLRRHHGDHNAETSCGRDAVRAAERACEIACRFAGMMWP